MRLYWLLATFALGVALYILNSWAVSEHLYYLYRWADIPMHVLGGLTIGAFLVSVLEYRRMTKFVLLFIALIASWEVFEYFFHLIEGGPYEYALDTIYDLVNGALGATIAYLVARKTIWR